MYGIFTYIYPQNYPNVVLKRPYMEHLGSVLMARETFMTSYTLLDHNGKKHQLWDLETPIFFGNLMAHPEVGTS